MKTLKYAKALVRKLSKTEGVLEAVVGSTDTVDRYGEVIDQKSWDLKHYKTNPVILWAHNLSLGEEKPPIGKALNVTVKGDKLMFDIEFDMEDPFAADIYRKYKNGFLNAFSVGFIPHKIQRSDDNSEAPILMDNELLELSAVPVPANPEALNALRQRSFQAKSFESMIKEAETETEEHKDDVVEEHKAETETETPTEETPKKEEKELSTELSPENMKNLAEKVVELLSPSINQQISTVVSDALKSKASENGAGPKDPKNKSSREEMLVAVMRECTKQLQSALGKVNAEKKPTA